MISRFRDDYWFLSNMYRVFVEYNGLLYSSSEAAFQAQKSNDKIVQKEFTNVSGKVAKRMGRWVELRKDWEEVKLDVMYGVCKAKFDQNPGLRKRLLATGDEVLEESNNHGDKFWGTVNGVGENHLGKILMRLREEYKEV